MMDNTMVATVKIQLKPTKDQESKMFQFAGTSRFVYNRIVAYSAFVYSAEGSTPSLQRCIEYVQDLKNNRLEHEQAKDYSWIKETPEAVTKQAIKDLKVGYDRFYKGLSKLPKFKKRETTRPSFYQRTDQLKITSDGVKLTGLGTVNYSKRNRNENWLIQLTSFMNPRVTYDGKYWFLSFGVYVNKRKQENYTEPVGIDLGVKTLAVSSDGREFKNVEKINKRYYHYERRLKFYQRKFSRQYESLEKLGLDYKTAKNIKKTKQKIKMMYRKLTNIRKTYLHTITAEMVKTKPSAIVLETLNVKGMMKNRHLARKVAKQSFHTFKTYIKYKADFNGIKVIEADMFYASSKLCSCCGNHKRELKLSDRVYNCKSCGISIDRDYNASLNLKKLAN